MKKVLLSLLLSVPVLATESFGQVFKEVNNNNHHEFGVFVGTANYRGDLQKNFFPNYGYKPVYGLMYKYFMNPFLGIRAGLSYTNLTAADSLSRIASQEQRNLRFSTQLLETQLGLELNLLPVSLENMKVSPYVFGGVSVFYANPYTDTAYGQGKVFLRPLNTEGQALPNYPDRKPYSLVNFAGTFGGGLKAFVCNKVMFGLELGFRYTSTDYLDDVSKTYVNMDTLFRYRGKQSVDYSFRGDEVPGWDGNNPDYKYQRGTVKGNDWYWFGGVSVTIYLDAMGNTKPYMNTKCATKRRINPMAF